MYCWYRISLCPRNDKKRCSPPRPSSTLSTSFSLALAPCSEWQLSANSSYYDHIAKHELDIIRQNNWTVQIIHLTIHTLDAPEIVAPITDRRLVANKTDTVTLRCQFDGNPAPNVVWYYKDEQIGSGEYLKLDHVKQSDGGDYRCRAESILGVAENAVTLVVRGAPIITSEPGTKAKMIAFSSCSSESALLSTNYRAWLTIGSRTRLAGHLACQPTPCSKSESRSEEASDSKWSNL